QRLVDERPELRREIQLPRQELEHQHHDDSSLRVDAVRGAVGAAPAERADAVHAARAVALDGLEAQPEAQAILRMQIADLVRDHEADGARRQDALSVELAAPPQHLQKARIVASRRYQPGSARETHARSVDVMT